MNKYKWRAVDYYDEDEWNYRSVIASDFEHAAELAAELCDSESAELSSFLKPLIIEVQNLDTGEVSKFRCRSETFIQYYTEKVI